MNITHRINTLATLAIFLEDYTNNKPTKFDKLSKKLDLYIAQTYAENAWFTKENQLYALQYWANHLTRNNIKQWLDNYPISSTKKLENIGLVLAGNIPLVGFHDVLCVLLTGNKAKIKLSSKDKHLLPFLLNFWKELCPEIEFEFINRVENCDRVIATGTNNTARYFEYYFRNIPHILRKNRTSVAVLSGKETEEELVQLGTDIFSYFGLGCRNVTQLLIPKDFDINRLFKAFLHWKEYIHNNKYANSYDYQKAIFLLNKDEFWDNNFILLKKGESLFSPVATLFFKEYKTEAEAMLFIENNKENIQCVVSNFIPNSVMLGKAQQPELATYADGVDVMEWLAS